MYQSTQKLKLYEPKPYLKSSTLTKTKTPKRVKKKHNEIGNYVAPQVAWCVAMALLEK